MSQSFSHIPVSLPMAPPAFGQPSAPSPYMPGGPAITPGGMPSAPNFAGPPPQAPSATPGHAPDFMGGALPVLVSMFAGRHDPAVVGAGLAAYMKGRELKRQETEHATDRDLRRRTEQATFYSDLLKSAQTYDDEAALRRDLEAVRPIAELHGVNVDLIHVGDTKKAERTRKDAAATFEQLRKVHGASVDDPAWQSAHSTTVNGTTMKVSDLANLANMPKVTDQSGAPTPPASQFKADNPNELKIRAYARDHGKQPEQLTATEIQDALDAGKPEPAAGGTDYAKFLTRFAREHGKTVEALTTADEVAARKAFGQADDRPPASAAGATERRQDADAIAEAIVAGDQPPELTGLFAMGGPVRAALASRGYNQSRALLDWRATNRFLAAANSTQQVRLQQSIDALPDLLDSVDGLAAKWKGGRFPILNKANLAAAKSGAYGPDVASIAVQLDAQVADVVSDLANVYMGGNSPTEEALKLAQKSLAGEWDAKVFHDMVAMAKANVVIRRNSMKTAQPAGTSAVNPYAPPPPPVTPSAAPRKIRARDLQGVLHEADAGATLPGGWTLEK